MKFGKGKKNKKKNAEFVPEMNVEDVTAENVDVEMGNEVEASVEEETYVDTELSMEQDVSVSDENQFETVEAETNNNVEESYDMTSDTNAVEEGISEEMYGDL